MLTGGTICVLVCDILELGGGNEEELQYLVTTLVEAP